MVRFEGNPFAQQSLLLLLLIGSVQRIDSQKYEFADMDLLLVIDYSSSIKPRDFEHMIDTLKTLPKIFPIAPGQTRLGVIKFADTAKFVQAFTYEQEEFLGKMNEVKDDGVGGDTATDQALKMAYMMFGNTRRSNAIRVVLLVTDGCTYPHDPKDLERARKDAEEEAAKLRQDRRAAIFIVYIGSDPRPIDHQSKIIGDTGERFPIASFGRPDRRHLQEVSKRACVANTRSDASTTADRRSARANT